MASTDSIVIPVELGNLDVRKFLDQLGPALKARVAEVARGMIGGQLPSIPTTIVSKEQFQTGGKTFEAISRAKIKSVERSIGEQGQEDIIGDVNFSRVIKEVRQKVSNQIAADAKRLSDFKKSIKFQPLEIKQEAIRGFLGSFSDLEKSIADKLPVDQLREIRQFVDKASTFNPQTKQQLQNEISKFSESIQNLSSDEQQKSVKDYVKRFGDQNNELRFRLDKITATLRRKQFRKIELQHIDLPIEKRIQAYQDYVDSGKEFAREARAKIEKLKEVLGRQQIRKLKLEALELKGDERLKFIQQVINKGNVPIQEANAFYRQEHEKFNRQTQKQFKAKLSVLKTEDRIKLLEQSIKNSNGPVDELNRLLQNEREKLVRQKDRKLVTQLKTLKIEDRNNAIQEALRNGDVTTERADQLIQKEIENLKRQNLRKLKLDIIPLKDQDRIRLIEKRIAEGNLPIQEVNNLLLKEREKLLKQSITRFKSKLRTLEIEDRIPAIEKKIEESNRNIADLNGQLKKDKERITRKTARQTRIKLVDLKIEERQKAIQDAFDHGEIDKEEFNKQLKREIDRLKRQQSRKVRFKTKSILVEDRILAFEKAVEINNQPIDELNILLRKEKENLLKKTTRQFRIKLVDLKIEERQKAIQDALARGEIDKEEANQQLKKETDRLKRQQFRKFKQKTSLESPEQRIASIQQAVADGLLTIEEANILIAKESKRFVDSITKVKRQKFASFAQRLQTIDPNIAIKELDRYINQRTSAFVEEAKILRQRLQKQLQSARQQSQRDRSRNFANNMLVASGAGLGLLGAAGFPLLNIGFSAMSGGPVGAGIAAISTALGEGTRAINRFKESTVAAAKEVGFVGTGFKLAEARMKGLDAFIGQGSLAAQRAVLERELQVLKESGGSLRSVNSIFTSIVGSAKVRFEQLITGKDKFRFRDILESGPSQFGRYMEEFRKQRELTKKFELPELESALRNYRAMMNRSTVGIETSPYETWKRIQQAAFDSSKSEEVKIWQSQLKELEELVAIEKRKEAREIKEEAKARPIINPFGGMGGVF